MLDEMAAKEQKHLATTGCHEPPRSLASMFGESGVPRTVYTRDYCGMSETYVNTQDPQWDVCGSPRLRAPMLSFDYCQDYMPSKANRCFVDRLGVFQVKTQTLNSFHQGLPQTILFS